MNLDLFTWIYRLDFSDAVLITAVATVVFLVLRSRFVRWRWWQWMVWLLLGVSAGAIVYVTLVSRESVEPTLYMLVPLHSYREVLAGGSVEILRSNFMNVLLFYPAGLFAGAILPETWPGWRRTAVVLVVFAMVSAGIEYIQFIYCLGRVEIDDVIHNVLGALLGGLIGSCPAGGKTVK